MTDRTCIALDCDRAIAVKSKRLCFMHYQRFMKTGTTDAPIKTVKVCLVAGCAQEELIGSIGKGMCGKHYQRWRKYGATDLPDGDVQWWHDGRANRPSRCTEQGCSKAHKANGLCSMHDSRQARGSRTPEMCPWCWDLFTPLRGSQRFCSDQCAAESRAEYGRQYQRTLRATDPDRVAYQRDHRRALLLKARSVPFKRSAVFERDGWICQLCGDPVDPELKFPARMSVSLDHIIPLARDGEHTYENAQTAHLACNQAKGAGQFTWI